MIFTESEFSDNLEKRLNLEKTQHISQIHDYFYPTSTKEYTTLVKVEKIWYRERHCMIRYCVCYIWEILIICFIKCGSFLHFRPNFLVELAQFWVQMTAHYEFTFGNSFQ